MKRNVREIITGFLLITAIAFCTLAFSGWVLPYRDGYGALWGQFRQEEKNSADVMFFGTSIVYCNVSPSVLYEKTGVSSYVMAAPQLTMAQTYYYMKEAFKTQSPHIVFVEAAALFFAEYTDYTRINLTYLPYGANRVNAAFFAAEPEERIGVLFPAYHYHDLWQDYFDKEKPDFARKYEKDPLAGYMFLKETVEQDKDRERVFTNYSPEVYAENLEWLSRIVKLCEKQNIKLILYTAPMYKPLNAEYYEMLKTDAARFAPYIDYNIKQAEIGINPEEDYYDIFHLNYKGAYRFTEYIAPFVTQQLGELVKPAPDTKLWEERVQYFWGRADNAGGF